MAVVPRDYAALAAAHRARRPFAREVATGRFPEGAPAPCVLCERAPSDRVLFPCDHRCICEPCADKHHITPFRSGPAPDGTPPWHACPLCMEEIALVLGDAGGAELDQYWHWLHLSRPRLPHGFLARWRRARPTSRAASLLDDGEYDARCYCCCGCCIS